MTNMTPQKCDFLEIKILTLRLRSCCPEIKMPILLRGTYAQKKVEVSWRYKKKNGRGPKCPIGCLQWRPDHCEGVWRCFFASMRC